MTPEEEIRRRLDLVVRQQEQFARRLYDLEMRSHDRILETLTKECETAAREATKEAKILAKLDRILDGFRELGRKLDQIEANARAIWLPPPEEESA